MAPETKAETPPAPESAIPLWLYAIPVVLLGLLGFLLWRRRFTIVDAICVATVVAAYVPFMAMPALGGYGLRFQAPYGAALIFIVLRATDLAIDPLRARWTQGARASMSTASAAAE